MGLLRLLVEKTRERKTLTTFQEFPEEIEKAAQHLRSFPLYRPATEFCELVKNFMSLKQFEMNFRRLNYSGNENQQLICFMKENDENYKDLMRLYGAITEVLSYGFTNYVTKEEIQRVSVLRNFAKDIPDLKKDIITGKIESYELIPSIIIVDNQEHILYQPSVAGII